MAKYTYIVYSGDCELRNGADDPDEIFDTYDEAMEAACNASTDMRLGAELLNLSNPGDYPYDEEDFDDVEIEIVELED